MFHLKNFALTIIYLGIIYYDILPVALSIPYSPAFSETISPVNDTAGAIRAFNITINQTANVWWWINGILVQNNLSVTNATYTNTSAVIGIWNVSAVVSNPNSTAWQTWIWDVTAAPLVVVPPVVPIPGRLPTPTPTPTPTPEPRPWYEIPGFGAIFAILGLLAVAYLLRRREE